MSEEAKKRKSESANQRIDEPISPEPLEEAPPESAPQQPSEEDHEAAEILRRAMEPQYAPPQSPEGDLPYTVGEWKGFKQWRCKQCPWDTLESEAAMLVHIATVHAPPQPRVYVADKAGREIQKPRR